MNPYVVRGNWQALHIIWKRSFLEMFRDHRIPARFDSGRRGAIDVDESNP